jgi:hypothetical protein
MSNDETGLLARTLPAQKHVHRERHELITREISPKLPLPQLRFDTLKLLEPAMEMQELPPLDGLVFGL